MNAIYSEIRFFKIIEKEAAKINLGMKSWWISSKQTYGIINSMATGCSDRVNGLLEWSLTK